MREQNRLVSSLRKGTYYLIKNCENKLALSMPDTNKFNKDKPEFQIENVNNVNQFWMIEQISPNRYQIVHAISTLVLECEQNYENCKLQFGKQKNNQIFCIEQDYDKNKVSEVDRTVSNNSGRSGQSQIAEGQDIKEIRVTSRIGRKSNLKISEFKAGQKFRAFVRIKEKQGSNKYLYCESITKSVGKMPHEQNNQKTKINVLKFKQIDIFKQRYKTLWQIQQIKQQENLFLSSTCIISSLRSGLVLDVPEASEKKQLQIIQYPCNFRMNQRWILKKVDESNGYNYYTIYSAKTGLCLDIKGNLNKQGTNIIQFSDNQDKNQIWRLQEQGKRTYIIRSALDKELVMGIKQNSLKEGAALVTCKAETQCFWVIYGKIPQ